MFGLYLMKCVLTCLFENWEDAFACAEQARIGEKNYSLFSAAASAFLGAGATYAFLGLPSLATFALDSIGFPGFAVFSAYRVLW